MAVIRTAVSYWHRGAINATIYWFKKVLSTAPSPFNPLMFGSKSRDTLQDSPATDNNLDVFVTWVEPVRRSSKRQQQQQQQQA